MPKVWRRTRKWTAEVLLGCYGSAFTFKRSNTRAFDKLDEMENSQGELLYDFELGRLNLSSCYLSCAMPMTFICCVKHRHHL